MPNRSSKTREVDPNVRGFLTVMRATGQVEDDALIGGGSLNGKNPAAVALGRLGGRKGGPARAASLSAAKRKAIAKRAARARWASASKGKARPR